MKTYIKALIALPFVFTSCSDFLDRAPADALSPSTFWKTEKDATLALTGCYNGFESGSTILYRDCGSDNAYNYHRHEGWQVIGNGEMTQSDTGAGSFGFGTIRRCNEFLENVDKVTFTTEGLKEQYTSEARFIRAYRYFIMTQSYGDVPLVTRVFQTPQEAEVPRDSKETVEQFIIDELKAIIDGNALKKGPGTGGRISHAAAQALLMRVYLFKGMYAEVKEIAGQITGYSLFNNGEGAYNNLFLMANENNNEAILEIEHIKSDYGMSFGAYTPNSAGGWSSIVPLQTLVDSYEMADGLTIEEAKAAGTYDETNPYVNRDPRLSATIVYPGQVYNGKVYSSVVAGNDDNPTKADNSTKTGYNFKKYINPIDQYDDMWNTGRNMMVIRYAEVLLSKAEAMIELNLINDEMYAAIDAVRERAGMPAVDRNKYNSQDKLRELVRRERRVEFAYEGMRRFDIIRWNIAKDVLNGKVYGCRQAGNDNPILEETYPNGDHKVNLQGEPFFVETRTFAEHNKYLPLSQSSLDKNPKLVQNEGY